MGKLKLKVLVVDDEATQRELLKDILLLQGFEAHTAADGDEALKRAEDLRPHIILSDLRMPRMNGLELLTEIKEKYPDTIFVLLTAHPDHETRSEAMSKGARLYLAKPIDVDDLCRRLAEATAQ